MSELLRTELTRSRRLGFGPSAESNIIRGNEGKTELGAVVGSVD